MASEESVPIEFFGFVALLGIGGVALALSVASRSRQTNRMPTATIESFSERDVEALARMFASENPRASKQLHIEQAWTQIRSRRRGQSVFDRITGGAGFGTQEERDPKKGALRPVSTALPATDAFRELAREILAGVVESAMPGARTFFDPDQQDKAFAVGKRAREKRARGETLTKQEARLIHYVSDAADIRRRWLKEGHRFVDSLDGVEFYT